MSVILVTGGSGFVGSHCIVRLLQDGHTVRTTVRSPRKQDGILNILKVQGIDTTGRLSVFQADLLADEGWQEAVTGCDYVLHVASPFPQGVPRDENELILPAREGTLRVLRFARDAGVKRVVMTSSSVAITYGHSPQIEPFDETSWTDLNSPAVPPYPRSKTLAEQAGWDFLRREGGRLEMAVVNPTGIFGPVISPELSTSVAIIQQMLQGKLPALPKASFGVVDVRDVVDLHIRAMESPDAAGQRFLAVADGIISFKDIALLLKQRLGDNARKVGSATIPDWVIRFLAVFARNVRGILPELGNVRYASNEKARRMLNWTPRPIEDAIVATAETLIRNGFVIAGSV